MTREEEGIAIVEKRLRLAKQEEYATSGVVKGITVEAEDSMYPTKDTPPGEIEVLFQVVTEHNQKIVTRMDFPVAGWDLTNSVVVLLEYLEIEPEQMHTLNPTNSTGETYSVPVTFDYDHNTYRVDFSRMRDEILE